MFRKEYERNSTPMRKTVKVRRTILCDSISRSESPKDFYTTVKPTSAKQNMRGNLFHLPQSEGYSRTHILNKNKQSKLDVKLLDDAQVQQQMNRTTERRNCSPGTSKPQMSMRLSSQKRAKSRRLSRKKLRQLQRNEKILSKTVKRLSNFKHAKVCNNYMLRIARLTYFNPKAQDL